jgi:UDP-glucose 4-epimerase
LIEKVMKVLVTGGLGFIGSNLTIHLCHQGHQVSVLDNLDSRMGGNWANLEEVMSKVHMNVQDLLDFGQVSAAVLGQDMIINCAASTSHPSSMREPWLDMDVNVKGTLNLLEAIRRFNPRARLIHLGTSTQLGPLKYSPADEQHSEFPTDIYSANKSTSEKYVLIYSNAYQLKASVVRLANVYGPRAAIHSPDFTFNNYFIGLALQDKKITIFGDGAQKRNLLFIDDVVDAILAVANCEKTIGETYFAVGDNHMAVFEIAKKIVDVFGAGRCKTIPWPKDRKSAEIGDAILSNQKIKKDTAWFPKTSLEDGLKLTQQFYLSRLKQYI